jgi:ankyrin repeat protein
LQRFDILTIAAINNDIELAKIALEGGTDPRAVAGNYDGTALISAAHLGHVEIVKALIAAKANLDHVNSMGWTALLMCVVLGNNSKEHIATVEALVKAGADVDIKDRSGNSALAHARARRYDEMIKIMEPATGRKTMLQEGNTL